MEEITKEELAEVIEREAGEEASRNPKASEPLSTPQSTKSVILKVVKSHRKTLKVV